MSPEEVADQLRGTCDDIDDLIDIHEQTMQWGLELDHLVLRCEQCGWWVDSDETNDDCYCEDCAE